MEHDPWESTVRVNNYWGWDRLDYVYIIFQKEYTVKCVINYTDVLCLLVCNHMQSVHAWNDFIAHQSQWRGRGLVCRQACAAPTGTSSENHISHHPLDTVPGGGKKGRERGWEGRGKEQPGKWCHTVIGLCTMWCNILLDYPVSQIFIGEWRYGSQSSSGEGQRSRETAMSDISNENVFSNNSHLCKLASALMLLSLPKADHLLTPMRVPLIHFSTIGWEQPMATVDWEVLNLTNHGPVQHQLPRVALLLVYGAREPVLDYVLDTHPTESVPTLDWNDGLPENLLADRAHEGWRLLHEFGRFGRHRSLHAQYEESAAVNWESGSLVDLWTEFMRPHPRAIDRSRVRISWHSWPEKATEVVII